MSKFALISWDPHSCPHPVPCHSQAHPWKAARVPSLGPVHVEGMQAGPDMRDWGEEAALWGRDMWGVRPDSWGSVDLSTGTICVL